MFVANHVNTDADRRETNSSRRIWERCCEEFFDRDDVEDPQRHDEGQ